MLEIDRLIYTDPESIRKSPIKTPIGRLDETMANRQLDLRWTK